MDKFSKFGAEKELAKLQEILSEKNFESIDEINNFLNSLSGQGLDKLPSKQDNKSRSFELVYEAYDQPRKIASKMIKGALELDPTNVDAYNFLAEHAQYVDTAIKYYSKAIRIGRKTLGKKYFAENMGHFWGLLETRSFMRALEGMAASLVQIEENDLAIKIYQEMLDLNPNDNQGIRYLLSPLLLAKDDLSEYEEFIEIVGDENTAVFNYNEALYLFKKLSKCPKSDAALNRAYKQNKHVLEFLAGLKEPPQTPPQYVRLGHESEAISYLYGNLNLWSNTKGAIDWIIDFMGNKLIKKARR